MQYRLFGRTGVKVAPLALGTANFGRPTPEDEAERIINRALEAGINLIDSGNTYADGESERIIGRVLQRNGRRHDVFAIAAEQDGRVGVLARKRDVGRRIVPRPRQAAGLPQRDDGRNIGVLDRRDLQRRTRN